jgi:regulator of sigma E protease
MVGDITKGKGAEKAGLQPRDKIVGIDGVPVKFYHEFKAELGKHAGEKVTLDIERPTDKEMMEYRDLQLDVDVSSDSILGFQVISTLDLTKIEYGFLEAIPVGTKRAFSVVWVNIKAFGKMFRGELSPTKNLRGPLGIMEAFGPTWDWIKFWTLTGLISMVLAFMNLLPIPALDGGHVVFLSYEIISGRKPSDKFLENAQKVGMVLLLGLMVFVFYNDIMHLIQK